jgi:uncharacterized protein (TIRG00374 family)
MEETKKKKNDKFWLIVNISFVTLVFVGLVIYILTVEGYSNVATTLNRINYWWLLIGIIFTVAYWLLEGLCFYVITKKIYPRQRFISSFRLAMIGRLFNNITPLSCGDQPAQLVTMKKEGKTIGDGVSILLTRFIVYQFVLIVYTLVILFFNLSYFNGLIPNFMFFAMIGFVINAFVIVLLISVVINEKLVYTIGKGIIILLTKIKIIKDKEKGLENLKETISNLKEQVKIIKKERMMIAKVAIYTAIEITVLYSITYIVYKAFGYTQYSFSTIIAAQAILSLVTVYMPTPGASGTAEGGFHIVFSKFIPQNTIMMAILFWRIFTFYLPIIVGAIFMLYKPKEISEKVSTEIDS